MGIAIGDVTGDACNDVVLAQYVGIVVHPDEVVVARWAHRTRAPQAERHDRALELAAVPSQFVGDSRRGPRLERPSHEARRFELAKPCGQHIRGDAGQTLGESAQRGFGDLAGHEHAMQLFHGAEHMLRRRRSSWRTWPDVWRW